MSKRKRRKIFDINRHLKRKRARNERRKVEKESANNWQEAPGMIKGIFDEQQK